MHITIVGTGYVGLVSGACLAQLGHTVTCVDHDTAKIAALQDGACPIFEPGLEEMIRRNLGAGRLRFTEDLAQAAPAAEAIFIAVGTPSREIDGHADLRQVFAAAEASAALARDGAVIVVKSTVPVGTNTLLAERLRPKGAGTRFHTASNPEFLREGVAIEDFMHPDRVVIGADTAPAREVLAKIYAPLSARGTEILHTGCTSAEMIKYAANAFLATKVAFINEVSELCDRLAADVADVARGVGLDTRIGGRFLRPGPGIGGSCFPKDIRSFARLGQDHGFPMQIVEATIASNEMHKARMVEKLRTMVGGAIEGLEVTVFGVTFKPDTDDMRESPALTILPALTAEGARLRIVDPEGRKQGEALLPAADWQGDPYKAAEGADLIVVLTEWGLFETLDLKRLARAMRTPRLADLRNIYAIEAVRAAGFTSYTSVGRTSRFAAKGTEGA